MDDQLSLGQQVATLEPEARAAILDSIDPEILEEVVNRWEFKARPEQMPPTDDFLVWVNLGGRGAGKSRTVAEWAHDRIAQHLYSQHGKRREMHRIAAASRTASDNRETLVEGESGLIAVADRRGINAHYQPSKRRISWVDDRGEYARATLFSAEEPDQARGPQYHTVIGDEFAAWDFSITDEVGNNLWTNLLLGLRLGDNPKAALSTTPKRIRELREIVGNCLDPDNTAWVLSRATTLANAANLSDVFLDKVLSQYEGTRLYRQEVLGLLLDDDEDVLWTDMMIVEARRFLEQLDQVPAQASRVVGVDPPTEDNRDHCGIVAAATFAEPLPGRRRKCVGIIADRSLKGSPETWAKAVVELAKEVGATKVVAESNQGGQMVRSVINNADEAGNLTIELVKATTSKHLRAEPVAQLYEQQRVVHLDDMPELEDEQVNFLPGQTDSPDRLDAMVHAVTFLLPEIHDKPATVSSASKMRINRTRQAMNQLESLGLTRVRR